METTVNTPNDANDNAVCQIDDTINYADIAYACIDKDIPQDPVEEHMEEQSTCIYNEICSAQKMCGDCCADEFERERNEQCWENFKLDRKI